MADNFPQLSDVLRCPQAPVDVNSINTDATPQAPGGKRETLEQFQPMAEELSELQERLFARGRNNPDHARRVLIVLQGLDTAGKGGVVRHVVAMVDPQGINHHSFKAPTQEELRHDFLWRVKKALPEPGMLIAPITRMSWSLASRISSRRRSGKSVTTSSTISR